MIHRKKKKKRKILVSPEPVPVPVPCDFCGKPAVVFDNWMDVNLCPKCAVIPQKDREAS